MRRCAPAGGRTRLKNDTPSIEVAHARARRPECASKQKNIDSRERVFFISAQALEAPSKNALAYDGCTSGAIIYQYVGGNPVNSVDPSGLIDIPNPNGVVPGGPWTPNPGNNPGSFNGPKPPGGGPRAQCQFVPDGANGGTAGAKDPYWKTRQPGQGWGQRYDLNGNPITPEEAHPGNRPPTIPRLPFIPFILCPVCTLPGVFPTGPQPIDPA